MTNFGCRWIGCMTVSALFAGMAAAQDIPPNVAVPYYTPDHFVQGLYREVLSPKAKDFNRQTQKLQTSAHQFCAASNGETVERLAALRAAWSSTARAWDSLSAVSVGPVLKRRSQRQIDFSPTRPALIERAIQASPANSKDMERVGTPAKGFPALEWLLWTQPVQPHTPACSFAVQVAAELAREAVALDKAFADDTNRDWGDGESAAAMAEVVNQWLGGLERLRWAHIEKPLREAQSKSGTTTAGKGTVPDFPRLAGNGTAASWAAQWEAISAVAIARSAQIPEAGTALVPLETYLRGRGLNPLASQLRQIVLQADQRMMGLAPGSPERLLTATRELAALKRFTEAKLAPALQVNIGFSDADGD